MDIILWSEMNEWTVSFSMQKNISISLKYLKNVIKLNK